MSEKSIHIAFQVFNFVFGNASSDFSLLPIDKLLLILLAKHHGVHGIFPTQETLANELKMSKRHIRIRTKFLANIGLISIKRLNRKYHYFLDFLSTIEEPQFRYDSPIQESIGELQFLSEGNYSSSHRGTTVHTKNPIKNPIKKTERACKKRMPLSEDFRPDQKTKALVKSLSLTDDQRDDAFDKFFEYFLDSDEKKRDWQKTCRIWFRRERTYLDSKGKGGKLQAVAPTRQPDTYKKREKEPTYTDPVKAQELMKGIMKSLKSQGGLTNGISPKVRGNGQSG